MQTKGIKPMIAAVPRKGIDAVGMGKSEPRRWYIAIVNNKSEKLCRERLEQRIINQPVDGKDYEVYVASQKEWTVTASGKRTLKERIVLRALVFICCTDSLRRQEIAHLPYIKRFMVNIAGERSGSVRPVAYIPDYQMADLRRMLNDADEPVTIDPQPVRLGTRVRINGGKLRGMEGYVLETPDGSTDFVIRIDLLGCAKIRINSDLLDLI